MFLFRQKENKEKKYEEKEEEEENTCPRLPIFSLPKI